MGSGSGLGKTRIRLASASTMMTSEGFDATNLSSRDGVMMHSITFPSSPLCGHPMCRAWASAVTAGQSPTWHTYSLATGHAGLAPSPVSECRRHLLVMRQRQEKERLSELTGGAVERCMSRR